MVYMSGLEHNLAYYALYLCLFIDYKCIALHADYDREIIESRPFAACERVCMCMTNNAGPLTRPRDISTYVWAFISHVRAVPCTMMGLVMCLSLRFSDQLIVLIMQSSMCVYVLVPQVIINRDKGDGFTARAFQSVYKSAIKGPWLEMTQLREDKILDLNSLYIGIWYTIF